ncbi:MAG: hypothetical protein KKA73_00670, partial [Chloroflexi bacterium]|nr:hypothetical protein [Chloroflexota bacterium]
IDRATDPDADQPPSVDPAPALPLLSDMFEAEWEQAKSGTCPWPARLDCADCPAIDECTVDQDDQLQPTEEPTWGIDDQPPLVNLDALTLDDEIQLASRPLDYRIVAAYAEAITNGAEFPPIVVFSTEMQFLVADGFHRVAAHQAARRPQIRMEMRQGTRQDALIYAATANVAHGRAMTQAEKREAGYRLIQLTDLSNREIGRRLAVSEGSVRNWRDALSAQSCADSQVDEPDEADESDDGEDLVRTVTRGDTTYKMAVANIGQSTPLPAEEGEGGEGESALDAIYRRTAERQAVNQSTGEVIDRRAISFQKAAERREALVEQRESARPPIPVSCNGGAYLLDLDDDQDQVGDEQPGSALDWVDDDPDLVGPFDDEPVVVAPDPAPARQRTSISMLLARIERTAGVMRSIAASLELHAGANCPLMADLDSDIPLPCANIAGRLRSLADYLQDGTV